MIDAHRIHTQEEDMEQDFIEAAAAVLLIDAWRDAVAILGEEEAKAVFERELQNKRVH